MLCCILVWGLGVKLRDLETNCRYTTLPREAIALEMNREKLSEEMRILYVAMTRAKEKLIMLSTVKNLDRTLAKISCSAKRREKTGAVCGEPRFQFFRLDFILRIESYRRSSAAGTRHGRRQYHSAQFFTAMEHECGTASKTGPCDRRNGRKNRKLP